MSSADTTILAMQACLSRPAGVSVGDGFSDQLGDVQPHRLLLRQTNPGPSLLVMARFALAHTDPGTVAPVICPNVKRGEDGLRIAAVGATDLTASSSPARAAESCRTSAEAEPCIASATIKAAVVEFRTADRPL